MKVRAWLKRNKRRVVAAIKEDPFAKDGKIKVTALRKLRNTSLYELSILSELHPEVYFLIVVYMFFAFPSEAC